MVPRVGERSDGSIIVTAVEGDGKLLTARAQDTVVNDISTSGGFRHEGSILRE